MESISKKSYIVTGAGNGIGKETALMLVKLGAFVTAADLKEESAKATANEINAAGGKAIGVAADVSDEKQVKDIVDKTVAEFGGLDGAANSAGISSHSKTMADLTLEEWNKVIAINLTGSFLCLKYQSAAIAKGGKGGSIVVVSSAAAWKAYPALTEYAASNSVLGGLIRSAAAELGKDNIRVNTVLPGRTDTAMHKTFSSQASDSEKDIEGQQSLKHMAQPKELAEAIVWLLSDQSSFNYCC